MNRPIATLDLSENKIQELHNKGYIFCEDINLETVELDTGISGEDWKKLTQSIETKTALDLCEDETTNNIVTFSSSIDEILGGGISLKTITEVCGLPGSGKTQFCLQLCVAVQLPNCFGGIDGEAVFIDTNLGFTPGRLSEMATGCIKYCQEVAHTSKLFEMYENLKLLNDKKFLMSVHYLKAVTFIELLAIGNKFKKILDKNKKIKLIVIDNITDPIKNSDLNYFDRIKLIYSFLSDLQKLAHTYKFAIVVTNDMTSKLNEQGENYITPSLGDSFAHRINSRIKLEYISGIEFNVTFVKSVLQPISSARFQIVQAGIRDI